MKTKSVRLTRSEIDSAIVAAAVKKSMLNFAFVNRIRLNITSTREGEWPRVARRLKSATVSFKL